MFVSAPRVSQDELEVLIAEGLSQREIATRVGLSHTTVRYWLTRFGLRTRAASRRRIGAAELGEVVRDCPVHGPTVFVVTASRRRCKLCRQEYVSRRRRRVKQILLEEAGGRCVLCGYDNYPGALQFHHIDRDQKTFGLSTRGVARALHLAREEAEKCVVLCANCHAEVEAGVTSLPP